MSQPFLGAAPHEPAGDLSSEEMNKAVGVLEARLQGEDWFLDRVRGTVRSHLGLEADAPLDRMRFETITTNIGHDYIIHVAQFYFFLRALNCQSVEQIDALMDTHNQKIEQRLTSGEEIMKENQLKSAIFKSNRKANVRDTFAFFGRPIFAISEVASLLFDTMSPTKTTSVMKELLDGGILTRLDADQTMDAPISTDPRRILVEPTGSFVEDYAKSLLMTQVSSSRTI